MAQDALVYEERRRKEEGKGRESTLVSYEPVEGLVVKYKPEDPGHKLSEGVAAELLPSKDEIRKRQQEQFKKDLVVWEEVQKQKIAKKREQYLAKYKYVDQGYKLSEGAGAAQFLTSEEEARIKQQEKLRQEAILYEERKREEDEKKKKREEEKNKQKFKNYDAGYKLGGNDFAGAAGGAISRTQNVPTINPGRNQLDRQQTRPPYTLSHIPQKPKRVHNSFSVKSENWSKISSNLLPKLKADLKIDEDEDMRRKLLLRLDSLKSKRTEVPTIPEPLQSEQTTTHLEPPNAIKPAATDKPNKVHQSNLIKPDGEEISQVHNSNVIKMYGLSVTTPSLETTLILRRSEEAILRALAHREDMRDCLHLQDQLDKHGFLTTYNPQEEQGPIYADHRFEGISSAELTETARVIENEKVPEVPLKPVSGAATVPVEPEEVPIDYEAGLRAARLRMQQKYDEILKEQQEDNA